MHEVLSILMETFSSLEPRFVQRYCTLDFDDTDMDFECRKAETVMTLLNGLLSKAGLMETLL